MANHWIASAQAAAIRALEQCSSLKGSVRILDCSADSDYYSCAAISGIHAAIVSRANEIATLAARGENLVAACAVLSTEETQTLQQAVCTLHKLIR